MKEYRKRRRAEKAKTAASHAQNSVGVSRALQAEVAATFLQQESEENVSLFYSIQNFRLNNN